MRRVLVWPWHGRVTAGYLSAVFKGQRVQAFMSQTSDAASGPGDNHRIVVPGIQPISDEEQARTPAGGQYWAGRALISSGYLYNKPLAWIYQAPSDSSKWAVSFIARTIGTSTSTVSLQISRFGEVGRVAEKYTRTLSIPVARLDQAGRAALFSDLGSLASTSIRLHAVSDTGRTAILAFSVYNTSSAQSTDTRPRAYAFVKVSIAGSGAFLSVSQQVLYQFDDVRNDTGAPVLQYLVPGGNTGALVEKSRTQLPGGGGDRVTYEYEKTVDWVEASSPGPFTIVQPMSFIWKQNWLVAVFLDGENPVPCYLRCTYTGSSYSQVTLSTVKPQIMVEYYDGTNATEQPGESMYAGGGGFSGHCTIKWDGPGPAWEKSFSMSTTGTITGSSVMIDYAFNGQGGSSNGSWPNVGEPIGAQFQGDRMGRMPVLNSGYGLYVLNIYFVLYSNNAVAVAVQKNAEPAKFEGVFTPEGLIPVTGEMSLEDFRHYGCYNPFTSEVVAGSPSTVNFI